MSIITKDIGSRQQLGEGGMRTGIFEDNLTSSLTLVELGIRS